MLQQISRYGRHLIAAGLIATLPGIAQGAVIVPRGGVQASQPDFHYGLVKLHPHQILLTVSTQSTTTATFRASQRGNTNNHYRANISCALNLLRKPRVKMTGAHGNIHFPATGLPLNTNFLCQVTVLGEGGVTGVLPVYVTVGL